MKRKRYAAMAIAAVMLLGGCGTGGEVREQTEISAETSAQTAEETEALSQDMEESEKETEAGRQGAAEIVETFLDMLGKTDEETADLLGGGEQNTAADGTLIGRIFHVELFGETVEAGTLCDEEQRVTVVTMQLEEPGAAAYTDQLTEILGEPEIQETEKGETGASATVWEEEKGSVWLYQSYGLVSLEFRLN